jgi:hypothetical protein
MTPVLLGRLQTRIFVVAVIGSLWTLIITPVLPDRGDLSAAYGVTYRSLLIVLLAGLVWEFIYHGLQQFRWEKDWPTMFGLITGINEGIVVWFIMVALDINVTATTFLVYFITTWIVLWLWINGPMKVVFIRWRWRGGRLV